MNAGKLLFAQLMDFLPWTSFARSVARYGGDRRVRNLTCAEQFRAMAFAQLAYRESLRDIEACLNAQPNKLFAMGFRSPVRRSTLAEANESRDWRIVSVWSDPVDDPRGRVFGIRTDFPKCPLILSGHFGKHWSGGFGGWLESISEIPGQQFFDPVDRMFGDADQDLAEIGFRVHSVQLG